MKPMKIRSNLSHHRKNHLVCLTALYLSSILVGCSPADSNSSSNTSSNSGSASSTNPATVNIVGGCSWLPYAPPLLNFSTFNLPDAIRISIANANGQPIALISNYSGAFSSQAATFNSSQNVNDAEAIKKYPSAYLLIECDYGADTRYYPKSFTLRGIFSLPDSKTETLVVSVFSDVIYKAVMKTSLSNLNTYQNILTNKFGSASFIKDVPIFSSNSESYKFDEKSDFYKMQSSIANNATSYVKNDFSSYTDYAATHLTGNCIDASLCSFLGVR
jgi:hypothetical protein